MNCTDSVVAILKDKFPSSDKVITTKDHKGADFTSSKILPGTIFRAIMASPSKAGGINHMGYHTLKKLIRLGKSGNSLIHELTNVANCLANKRIHNLSDFLATRTLPIQKSDGTPRPVGIGDVVRRICLKVINQQYRNNIILACHLQFGNGLSGGNEALIHALHEVSQNMDSNDNVILKLDAKNAFNLIDRQNALNSVYKRVPSLYLACLNTYGEPSYTVIGNNKIPVESGTCQGCPLAGSFFNLGFVH